MLKYSWPSNISAPGNVTLMWCVCVCVCGVWIGPLTSDLLDHGIHEVSLITPLPLPINSHTHQQDHAHHNCEHKNVKKVNLNVHEYLDQIVDI